MIQINLLKEPKTRKRSWLPTGSSVEIWVGVVAALAVIGIALWHWSLSSSLDEALVRRFDEYGFESGLRPSPTADTLYHSGLYSLLVRGITAHGRAQRGDPIAPLPPYRPEGVKRSALLPKHPR